MNKQYLLRFPRALSLILENLLQANVDRFMKLTVENLITVISGSFGFSSLITELLLSLLFTSDDA